MMEKEEGGREEGSLQLRLTIIDGTVLPFGKVNEPEDRNER